ARFRGAAARRGPNPDGAWRQGARSPDRVSAGYDAAAETARNIVVDRARGAAVVAPAGRIHCPGLHCRTRGGAPARAAGISASPLCRPQPGAGPALYLRLANADTAKGR